MRYYDLATSSMVGGSGIAEAKIPLWWADGATQSQTTGTAGTQFLDDGYGLNTLTDSRAKLYTLNANWSANQKYAFEATLKNGGGGSYTAYAALWDFTPNSLVSISQISITSTTLTVARSGLFTLIPGHQYGVTAWSSSGSASVAICDASLIVFP